MEALDPVATDPAHLSAVVRFDLPRSGAQVTGLALSAPARAMATRLPTLRRDCGVGVTAPDDPPAVGCLPVTLGGAP